MIDYRLISQNEYVIRRNALVDRAREAAQAPWFDRAVTILATWFEETSENQISPSEHSASHIFESIVNLTRDLLPSHRFALVPEIPPNLGDAIDALLRDQSPVESNEIGLFARWIWGKGLAAVCERRHQDAIVLSLAWKLVHRGDISIEAFRESLDRFLKRGNEPLFGSIRLLADYVATYPEQFVMSHDRQSFRQYLDRWRNDRRIESMWWWPNKRFFGFHAEDLNLLMGISRVQPTVFLDYAEALRIPEAVEQLLSSSEISDDFESIQRLLVVASDTSMHRGDYTVWSGRMTAPALLSIGLDHIERLVGTLPEEHRPQFIKEEASSLLNELARTALKRSDGLFLVARWGEELVRRSRGIGRWKLTQSPILTEAISTIATVLGNHINSLDHLLSVLKSVEGAGTENESDVSVTDAENFSPSISLSANALFLCILIGEEKPTSSQQDKNLLNLLRQLLLRSEPGLSEIGGNFSPKWWHWYPALLYARSEHTVEDWASDWRALSEQRRRAAHWFYSDDRPAYEPSKFLAIIGLALIDWLISDEHGDAICAECMWEQLFDSVFPLGIVYSGGQDEWQSIIVSLFARLPHLVAASKSDARYGARSAASRLSRLGSDDELFFRSAAAVTLNGISAIQIVVAYRELTGEDVIERARTFSEWRSRGRNAASEFKPLEPFLAMAVPTLNGDGR